ncbi:hypothetical protein ILUMI_04767 [Ignelater luminosus]|uniref:Uncharacterized protein n=1 Tax=Ignelater luminosus TaxID=2038154 RepID=A0A8K0DJ32_IGNLU|nr:hypothetical protein ILUMI_04767 [Ignelater luminosus]
MPPYEWGMMNTPYSPRPDIAASGKGTNWNRMLQMPRSPVTFLDAGRQQEVDDFYKGCQMHRDQYKDHAGRLHPLTYFKTAEYRFQCPPDLTSTYMKFPQYYTKYKDPPVLPITLDRSYRSPYLPERALTGRYSPSSDSSYKR